MEKEQRKPEESRNEGKLVSYLAAQKILSEPDR